MSLSEKSFEKFQDCCQFVPNFWSLSTRDIATLSQYFGLKVGRVDEMISNIYNFLGGVDLKEIIKKNEAKGIDCPQFGKLENLFPPPPSSPFQKTTQETPPSSQKRKSMENEEDITEIGILKKKKKAESNPIKINSKAILENFVERMKVKDQEILDVVEYDTSDEEEPHEKYFYGKFLMDETLHTITGVKPSVFFNLAFETESRFHQSRGPAPKISIRDSVFFLLHLYHSGDTFEMIGASFNIKPTTLKNAIDRVRYLLHDLLKQRWEKRIERPKRDSNRGNGLEHLGLLVDATSIHILRPTGKFLFLLIWY